MTRGSPTRSSRRGLSTGSSMSDSGAGGSNGEEKCTTVAIRLRPLNDRERAGKQSRIWRCVPTHNSITQTAPGGNPLPDAKGSTFFTYDRIFDEDSSTQEVYQGVAQDIVHSVVRGLNGTIFAYGQTSSGKTFTMQGGGKEDAPGIVQLAARDLFDLMEKAPDRVFLMRVSYLEIYQEEIKDLLNLDSPKLQVREDPRKGVYIDAHEEVVSDFQNVLSILNAGEKQRHVGCTEMNSRSSRSHTLFRLVVESQERYVPGIQASPEDVDPAVLVATLNLVDLAGSESVRHTGATGLRQKEGGKINQSLLTLSRVIQTLSQGGNAHVNYRDSKLTRILQPSLSGNAGMAIICCATAAEGYLEETRSTLQFASRAKEIKTRAIVNEVLDDKAQLRRVSQELAALKRQQAEGEGGSALVKTLQAEKAEQAAKIERLKKLLINIAPKDEANDLVVTVSPRFKRPKRVRETWCPGEAGVPLPMSLLDGADDSFVSAIDEGSLQHVRKRRGSAAGEGEAASNGRSLSASPRTPRSSRGGIAASSTTPGFPSPARARAMKEVAEMRERLSVLQAERDAMAAEAAAASAEISRVKNLETEVAQREDEVALLRKQLQDDSRAAVATEAEAVVAGPVAADGHSVEGEAAAESGEKPSDDRGCVESITAQLQAALEAKEALEEELTEFGEYTDMKDQEMLEMKERMALMEAELRQKEAELVALSAAEDEEAAGNARCADELQERVLELEAAVANHADRLREEVEKGANASADAIVQKEQEFVALNSALDARQKELAEHTARAEGAEEELNKLMDELASTKARLAQEHEAAKTAAEEAAMAVDAAQEAAATASLREREATASAQERIAALEAEKADLQQQEAELRARNDDAAALLAENEALLTSIASDEAQTADESTSATASADELHAAEKAVADAQAALGERDHLLEELRIRVAELEESLSRAEEDRRRFDAQGKEQKERADASLIEALAGQRRAENALSVAYQSQLEMRCRLEEATQQAQAAERAQVEAVEAADAAKQEKREADAGLAERIAEIERRAQAAQEARDAAEEARATAESLAQEVRGQLEDHKVAAEAASADLAALVEKAGAKDEQLAELEQESCIKEREMKTLLAQKDELSQEAASARSQNAELDAELQVLRESKVRVVEELEAKLRSAAASAEEASRAEVVAVRLQLEERGEEAATLKAAADAAEERVLAVETQASDRVDAIEARLQGAEQELGSTKLELEDALARAQKVATEAADLAERMAESEGRAQAAEEARATAESLAQEVRGELEDHKVAAEAASADLAALVEKAGAENEQLAELEQDSCIKEREMKTLLAQNAELDAELQVLRESKVRVVEELEAKLRSAAASAEEASRAEVAAVRLQLEERGEEAATLKAAADAAEGRVLAAETQASDRVDAIEARLQGAEQELGSTKLELEDALARAQKVATEAADLGEKVAAGELLEAKLAAVREQLAAHEREAADAIATRENDSRNAQEALTRAETAAAATRKSLQVLQREAEGELREAREAAAAALSAKDSEIAELQARFEAHKAVENELTQALEDSENLSKEVLDLTDQLMEKEAKLSSDASTIKNLRQQVDDAASELAILKESHTQSAASSGNPDGGHDDAALRRLRAELDNKSSELDAAIKDGAQVRQELKEIKGMLNAAQKGAGEAGADEACLRKKLSQLVCENGLLKGEKARLEAIAGSAATDAKAQASRTATEMERLARQVGELQGDADKAAAVEGESRRARVALDAAQSELSEVRRERAELQEASKKSLERCSQFEEEANSSRARLAELEQDKGGRDTVSRLETRVDELEEQIRRADATKAQLEGAERENANRMKRVQGEVDLMRSEYEVVSEEAARLRGSVAAAEAEVEEMSKRLREDRSEELEADISRLLKERAKMEATHADILRQLEEEQAALAAAHKAEHAKDKEAFELREEELLQGCEKQRKEAIRLDEEAAMATAALEASEARREAALKSLDEAKRDLSEAVEAGKTTEGQLRLRLNAQVAEAENLCEELAASRESCERAEANLRASEQRARDGADDKTRELLSEMENLCQDKLLAENTAAEMLTELERLRGDVAEAEKRAFEQQGAIIAASKETIAGLEQAAADRDVAVSELRSSLHEARELAATAAAEREDLEHKVRASEQVIDQKNARITKLEAVRLTKDQVEKLQAMKLSARKTAAENKELKERLAASASASAGAVASSDSGSAALAHANERIAELQGAKANLMERLQQYGKRLHELEKEHTRVRAAVELAGVAAPDGCDLAESVLEVVERSAGRDDGSMMSSFCGGDGGGGGGGGSGASERHRAELLEAQAALRKEEADRLAVQEQMRAGVVKYRALEAREASARERLEAAEGKMAEAVSTAVKLKEKDHERQVKYLQEENVSLFQENADAKEQLDKCKAELLSLKEKVSASVSQSAQAPPSAVKKRPCADRTNIPDAAALPAGKPSVEAKRPTAAADRRARSRALLDSPAAMEEEGNPECTQS